MLKEKVDAIIFGNLPINKKRVEIRKLKKLMKEDVVDESNGNDKTSGNE